MKCPKCNFENPEDTLYCGKCATPLKPKEGIPVSPTETLETPKEELTTGSVFAGRYQIIEVLGKGGMGKVYRALDKKLNEEVALKLVKPEIASDKKTLERFSNELRIARKIAHKNVGRMYELMEEKGIHFITMEYVPGEDLKSFIKRAGPLSAGKTTFIAKQICEGLAEAHELGVVHRDLKPQNIMIDKEGNSRIMDFGIARSLKAKGITDAGVMIGTPEYMSPEQVDAKETDQRSDIYSLGVILYEMVTGRAPFEGDTPLSVAVKQKTETPEDPRKLNSQIPEDLSRMILRCMEKDKGKRYQSAGELRSELDKIEQGIPTTERIVPKRKPITSREITVTFGMKKLFVPALVVVACVIIGVIVWQLLPEKEAIPPAPSGKPSLVVMYFKNNTGDESLDHWRTALSDLLIADLTQSKYIRVISGDRLFNVLRHLNLLEAKSYSSEDLRKVASRGRVNHILQGNLTKAGENFRINITLQEAATGELIGSESVDGKGEASIISMVDELTRRIKANFKLSAEQIAGDIDKKVGKITTSSPEALKYYVDGVKYFNKGELRRSIEFFEKAVTIDSGFAVAYRKMAAAYGNLGYQAKGREFRKKAFELTDRISDRERYQIQGDFYGLTWKTYDKAFAAYNKLLELYPDDLVGNSNLGWLYGIIEEWDKAIEQSEVNIKNRVEDYHSYLNSAYYYAAKGMYDKAKDVLELYLNDISDHAVIRWSLALNYLAQGKYDLAHIEVDKAISLDPILYRNFYAKGDIYHTQGDLAKAEKEYEKLLEFEEKTAHFWGRDRLGALNVSKGKIAEAKKEATDGIKLAEELGEKSWKVGFHLNLVYMHLNSGQPQKALEECDKALRSAVEAESFLWQINALYFKGMTLLEMESLDEALKVANELKDLIEKGMNRKAVRYYHYLMGRIHLERDGFSKAIENFEKAISLLANQRYPGSNHHALFFEPLALAYYNSGNLDKAEEQYKKIISLTTGRIFYGDIYAKSFYMLGKIYEQKGWKGKAIEQYEKFLDLWKDADPGIAEVEDAKKRLTTLKGE
jgi:serine/threonine protein kinase/Tfp pilus assembly protein PilF